MFKTFINKVFSHSKPAVVTPFIETSLKFVPPKTSGRAVQYPPQDPGFVCTDAVELVTSQGEIMGMLKMHAASTPTLYKERYEQPIINLSEHVANLPGSSSGVFAGEGGLMRACVEMAFNAFRASDGRIFTGASGVEERHLLEGRWRYVCFVAGLLYPVGATIQSMQVINAEGRRWSAELDSLQSWAGVGNRYWVTWTQDDVEPGPASIMGMLLYKIVGRSNIDWLNEGSPELIKRLVDIVTGSPAASSFIVTDVVKGVWSSIHKREVSRRHQNYGRLVVGSHISPYIIDAMVVLTEKVWRLNEKTVFADATGVHLEWPSAGTDIIKYCKERGYPGIPSSENALLTMLCSNKIIVGGLDGVALTEIANAQGEIVGAVKLSKPGLLVDDPSIFEKSTTRPVSMEAVVASDPLTASSPEKKNTVKKIVTAAETAHRPTLDTLVIAGAPADATQEIETPSNNEAPVSADESANPIDSRQTVETLQHPASGKPKPAIPFKEGAEIKYAALVDKEIVGKLKPNSIELLGKVVHAWREKTDPEFVMRMTSVGAAVEKDFVIQCSSRGLEAILEWASAGLLYIDPTRQGVKVHQIATVDGGQKKVDCVVFSRGTVKLLGLI